MAVISAIGHELPVSLAIYFDLRHDSLMTSLSQSYMRDDLAEAYRLVRLFKSNQFGVEEEASERQEWLMFLLAEDLGLLAGTHTFEELVVLVAEADSRWNNESQECASNYYAALEQGLVVKANDIRTQFLEQCPSTWYRAVVETL